MTATNRLPAIEALGEALAALEGRREQFRAGVTALTSQHSTHYSRFMADASQAIQHLANSGWTLTPGPTVNAGEDVSDIAVHNIPPPAGGVQPPWLKNPLPPES